MHNLFRDSPLEGHPSLGFILYRWRDWGEESDIQLWLTSFLGEKKNLPAFLAGFKGTRRSSMAGTVRIEVTEFIEIEGLKTIVDLNTLVEGATALLEASDLKKEDRTILETFLRDARPHLQ